MVTASHDDNGWTRVKMGSNRPVTFGSTEINRIKEFVLAAQYNLESGGSYRFVENFYQDRYILALATPPKLKRKPKVIRASSNKPELVVQKSAPITGRSDGPRPW
jgi:phosphomannomutase/phosphoglucomutase